MKDKSTCDFGKELEDYIAQKFQELGFTHAKRSKGSGNQGQLGDITGQDIMIVECKNRTSQDITLKEEVWDKLKAEIPLHSKRLPMYVLRNKNKKTWVVMDAEDIFKILKEWLDKT
jgi:Holliday junction resolvase